MCRKCPVAAVDTRRIYCSLYEKSAGIRIHYGRRRSSTLSSRQWQNSNPFDYRLSQSGISLTSLWNRLVTLRGDYQRHGLHSISMLAIGVILVTSRWITFPWIFFSDWTLVSLFPCLAIAVGNVSTTTVRSNVHVIFLESRVVSRSELCFLIFEIK